MAFFQPSTWDIKPGQVERLAHCGRCGLRCKCLSPRMPPTGKGRRRILFVGEAPGEQEDRIGEQLVGPAGQTLRLILQRVGVDLDDCWKTNAVICRPPKNVITDDHINACRPFLMATIRELKPTVIVALGSSSLKGLLPGIWKRSIGSLSEWLGWNIPIHSYGAWICPTYHPSYLRRMDEDEVLMNMVQGHLKKALSLETVPLPSETLDRMKSRILCLNSEEEAIGRLEGLSGKEGFLAFDYETTGLKPDHSDHKIVTCSYSYNGVETAAFRVTKAVEFFLSGVLKNPNLLKIASNLKFEERWTRAKLGHGVASWHWDTMLAAHILNNRPGVCSLKFQAFALLGVPDYEEVVAPYLEARGSNAFNRIFDAPFDDLLVYNGLDSLLEYLVMVKQKEMMYG